ncbi:MAG: ribosome maturation factor RimP [Bdellovibrionia bacterium]
MNLHQPQSQAISHPHHQLIELISPFVRPLGYRIIDLEVQTHRQKILRIYIDYLETEADSSSCNPSSKRIGIEDCVQVSRALDEPLEKLTELDTLLKGGYELEVSSPGVNRALRLPIDFQNHAGCKVRIHVFRALTGEELGNLDYQQKNPKQKNFLGILKGVQTSSQGPHLSEDKVILSFPKTEKPQKKNLRRSQSPQNSFITTNSEEEVIISIPLPLISKANLEPDFDFEGSNERE